MPLSQNSCGVLLLFTLCYGISLPCLAAEKAAESPISQEIRTGQEVPVERDFQALMRRANDALFRRDAGEAARLFEQASSQFGERPEAELGQARAYLLAGDFRQAVAYANLGAGEHSDFPPAIALLAFIEDRSGHTEIATSRLHAALKRWPEDTALTGALAEILIDRGASAKAISLLDERLNRGGNSTDLKRLRTRAATAIGDESIMRDCASKLPTHTCQQDRHPAHRCIGIGLAWKIIDSPTPTNFHQKSVIARIGRHRSLRRGRLLESISQTSAMAS